MKRFHSFLAVLRGRRFQGLLFLASISPAWGDLPLADTHQPHAPLSLPAGGAKTSSSNSKSERRELVHEFRGLLSLGARNHVFSHWKGKEMADCYTPQPKDEWRHKCEIITGQGNGFYYFYPDSAKQAPTLQRVEVFLQTSDEALLKDLRPTLHQLFGKKEMVLQERAGLRAVGPIRHWNTGEDIADLYLDATASLNGTVHFTWTRAPLANTKQARNCP